jgi:hypothetical protein
MPWVELEPTIPASERAKAVHALDRSATVTGIQTLGWLILWYDAWKLDSKDREDGHCQTTACSNMFPGRRAGTVVAEQR